MATAEVGPMDVRVEDDGQTRIRERYVVSTPLAGRLMRVTLEVGDLVTRDTVIARMQPTDPSLLDARAVAQAKARVRAAERKLAAAQAEQSRVLALLRFAETEMGRVERMHKENAASQRELDEKISEYEQRTEEARAAGYAVDIAKYELELEKAALLLTDPNREDGETQLPIKAPIDGRVLRINQESSTVLTAGAPLMEIGDPNDLEVVTDVLSRDAVRVSRGDQVEMKHWGGPHDLLGRVRLVEPSGFTKLSALGVEEQRVNIIIDFADPPEARSALGDGFRVDCEIIVWKTDATLQIPTSALFRIDKQWHVFTVEDGVALLRKVQVGQNNGMVAQVIDGLETGATVITHPSDEVQDGVMVAPR